MIAWLQPWALWGLGLLALPVAIHLLQRRRASRIAFPSTRFVRPSRTSAIRLRPPSDLLLLFVRTSMVALAVLACAQPLVLSASRVAAWNDRTARAIVIDTSASMQAPRADGRTAVEDALSAATAEAAAEFSVRLEGGDLREGLRRAVAWLTSAPPARREIVVISDFQHGSLTPGAIEPIEQAIGLRFVRVDGGERRPAVDGATLLQAPGGPQRTQRIQLMPEGTRVQMHTAAGPAASRDHSAVSGLRVMGDEAAQRILPMLADAGTPAPDPEQPIAILFPPAAAPPARGERVARWMLATLAGIERDPELSALSREIDATPLAPAEGWTVLIKDRRSNPLVRAAAVDGELLLQIAAPSSSYVAAAASRAALVSRHGRFDHPEREILTIPAGTLSAWTRAPGPVGEGAWRNADVSDARWFWAAALAWLLLEHVLRSRAPGRTEETRAAA